MEQILRCVFNLQIISDTILFEYYFAEENLQETTMIFKLMHHPSPSSSGKNLSKRTLPATNNLFIQLKSFKADPRLVCKTVKPVASTRRSTAFRVAISRSNSLPRFFLTRKGYFTKCLIAPPLHTYLPWWKTNHQLFCPVSDFINVTPVFPNLFLVRVTLT